jgi:hypothetical protein
MNNKARGFFGVRPLPKFELDPQALRRRTRRDVLLFGAGAVAALAGGGSLLPQDTLSRLGLRRNMNSPGKEWLLNRALRIDDDMAEALYSPHRTVPTYTKSQITPLKNNYNGATPDPGYIPGWHLTLDRLASGLSISLDIRNLTTHFSAHEQITRLRGFQQLDPARPDLRPPQSPRLQCLGWLATPADNHSARACPSGFTS